MKVSHSHVASHAQDLGKRHYCEDRTVDQIPAKLGVNGVIPQRIRTQLHDGMKRKSQQEGVMA